MATREEYENFLAEVRKQTGIEAMTSDDAGLVSVRVDEKYNVNLQFVEASGKVLCFIEVATLPPDAPKAVYRDLLAGGLFGKETAGGYFALEAESETVVYNYLFDLETAARDVEDFISTLEKILQLCDIWAERILHALSAGEAHPAEPHDPTFGGFSPDRHFHIHP
jgi:hypothetical protein